MTPNPSMAHPCIPYDGVATTYAQEAHAHEVLHHDFLKHVLNLLVLTAKNKVSITHRLAWHTSMEAFSKHPKTLEELPQKTHTPYFPPAMVTFRPLAVVEGFLYPSTNVRMRLMLDPMVALVTFNAKADVADTASPG